MVYFNCTDKKSLITLSNLTALIKKMFIFSKNDKRIMFYNTDFYNNNDENFITLTPKNNYK